MKNLFKVADACFANFSSFQDRVFYNKNVARETKCHEGEIGKSREHHSQGKMVSKKTHLMEIYVEMQKHFQTLNSDLLSTTKENGMINFLMIYFNVIITLSCPLSFGITSCSDSYNFFLNISI